MGKLKSKKVDTTYVVNPRRKIMYEFYNRLNEELKTTEFFILASDLLGDKSEAEYGELVVSIACRRVEHTIQSVQGVLEDLLCKHEGKNTPVIELGHILATQHAPKDEIDGYSFTELAIMILEQVAAEIDTVIRVCTRNGIWTDRGYDRIVKNQIERDYKKPVSERWVDEDLLEKLKERMCDADSHYLDLFDDTAEDFWYVLRAFGFQLQWEDPDAEYPDRKMNIISPKGIDIYYGDRFDRLCTDYLYRG